MQARDFQLGNPIQVARPSASQSSLSTSRKPQLPSFQGSSKPKVNTFVRGRSCRVPNVFPVYHLDAIAEKNARLSIRVIPHERIAIEMVFAHVQNRRRIGFRLRVDSN